MRTYDPYNDNPFATDDTEVKNEADANRELARTAYVRRISDQILTDLGIITDTYWRHLK